MAPSPLPRAMASSPPRRAALAVALVAAAAFAMCGCGGSARRAEQNGSGLPEAPGQKALKPGDTLPAGDGEVLTFFACRWLCQENARSVLNRYGVNHTRASFDGCEKRCVPPTDLARLVRCRTFCHSAYSGAESFECMEGCLPPAAACRGYCLLQPSLPAFQACSRKCGAT